MGDNSSGGSYAYRASKAAVNSVGKSLAMDLMEKGIVVELLHPGEAWEIRMLCILRLILSFYLAGYVKSNLNPSATAHPEAVEPAEAAEKLWKVFSSKGIEETGMFWHREGYEYVFRSMVVSWHRLTRYL